MKINLGDKVRDKISSFSGVAYGKTRWLDGRKQVVIKKFGLTSDDQIADMESFNEDDIIVEEPRWYFECNKENGVGF